MTPQAKLALIVLSSQMLYFPFPVQAYIGPGAGLGALTALWGLLVAVFMALGIIAYLPIKVVIRKIRGKKRHGGAVTTTPPIEASKDGTLD